MGCKQKTIEKGSCKSRKGSTLVLRIDKYSCEHNTSKKSETPMKCNYKPSQM